MLEVIHPPSDCRHQERPSLRPGLYAQFEAISALNSIEGPLKDQVVELLRRLQETEVGLKKAEERLRRKYASITKLHIAKAEADEAIQNLSTELELLQKNRASEIEQLSERNRELQSSIDQLYGEVERLKVGEGLDMEAFIDSDAFADIKDSIENSTGDELVRRIKEVYPDLNLDFLTAGSSNLSPVPHDEGRNEPDGTEKERVEPNEGNPNKVSRTTDAPNAGVADYVSPRF